jgi:RNA polymerase sigma-70 factor (ECF subfamily)
VHDPETLKLVRGALVGDAEARGLLLERIRPRVVTWCGARMPPSLRAHGGPEDLAQDVLLAVHEALASFRGEDGRSFHAWVFRIGENRIRDLLDHAGALKRKLPEPASFSQTSPSGAAMRRESAERVRAALATLADDYRTVIRLRRIEERPVPEIAAEMGRSENAVRILYFRALQALREALGDEP